MFDKLKKAFSSAAKGIGQKEITEKVLDDSLFDLQMSLLESDVAQEAVDSLSAKLKKELLGLKLEKGEDARKIIHSKLQNVVAEVFAGAGKFGLAEKIRAKRDAKAGPFVIVFLGINGTGKTTTVAKVANLLRKDGFTVVIAAGDTHRAGAIEQLTQHADRLSLKVIAQRYGADPSAVGRDAVEHARKNYIDVVLVDTAGRMQTSKNLMDEMGKIVRVVKPDAKLFIGDALAGNDTINQAREFYQYTNFDGAILTKIDADAKGGAAISIAYITSKPVVYVGVGQGYDDIIPFEPDKFIESLFGTAAEVKVEDLMSHPQISKTALDETTGDIEIKPVESGLPLEQEKTPSRPPVVPAASPSIIVPKQQEKPEKTVQEPLAKPPVQEPQTLEKQSEKAKDIPPPPKPKEAPKPEPVVKKIESSGESLPERPPDESKEKKGRFGGLFKKKTDEERKKEEEKSRKAAEERSIDEAERARLEEEEIKNKEKEKDEKKKRKEDKDTEEEKVVYLTDEDIEDLLK